MKTHGNRSIWACCLVFVALLVALPSHASEGNYYSFSVGAAVASDAKVSFDGGSEDIGLDKGLALGAAFGRGFGNYRVEGEIGYQKNDFGKEKTGPNAGDEVNADLSFLSLMCNGYYDFENLTQGGFTPYVSVGVGAVQLDVSLDDGGSDKDIVFAWQVGAGVERSLNDTMFLDIFYRYFDPLKGSFTIDDDSLDVDTASHNFMVQLRIMTN